MKLLRIGTLINGSCFFPHDRAIALQPPPHSETTLQLEHASWARLRHINNGSLDQIVSKSCCRILPHSKSTSRQGLTFPHGSITSEASPAEHPCEADSSKH